MLVHRRPHAQSTADRSSTHPRLRKLCIGLCAGAGLGLGAHLALFANIIGLPSPNPTMARALDPSTSDLGITVTLPDADTDADIDGHTVPSVNHEDLSLEATEPLDITEEDADAHPNENEHDSEHSEAAPSPNSDAFGEEGPTGPDATLAEATGMPMAGGPSASPLETLLQVVAKYQDRDIAAAVEAYDEATGEVVYAP